MNLDFNIYDQYITAIVGIGAPATNYFGKEVHVYLRNHPARFRLFLDNPAFYDILAYLIEVHSQSQMATVKLFGDEICAIPSLNFTEAEKQEKATNASYYVFKNETDMVTHSWQEYPQYTQEKKVKFWKRWLRKQMQRLDFYGFDPYQMYHEKLYNFWKSHEPDINSFLNQVIEMKELDKEKMEENLGFNIG